MRGKDTGWKFEKVPSSSRCPARPGSGCGTGSQRAVGAAAAAEKMTTGMGRGWAGTGGWFRGSERESPPGAKEDGWALSPTSGLQSCYRKAPPASPTRKDGWVTPWTPSAASAGHSWRPVAWRKRPLPFTQVPTLGTPGGGGAIPTSLVKPPWLSTPRK